MPDYNNSANVNPNEANGPLACLDLIEDKVTSTFAATSPDTVVVLRGHIATVRQNITDLYNNMMS